MGVDYVVADQFVKLAFAKLDKSNVLAFPPAGSLAARIRQSLDTVPVPLILNRDIPLLATAGVEMWHRALHSFLWSVALTESSPLWSSVSGYYASHFVMRAFAHSMGVFKSFSQKKIIQVTMTNGSFVLNEVNMGGGSAGEHPFYWKVVKNHPAFISDDIFRLNSERDGDSDSSHRTFANYTDHISKFLPMSFPSLNAIAINVEKISRIRKNSVVSPSRDDYPDLENVQILAFQRIVAFHDFLDKQVPRCRFWQIHRRPAWCQELMLYQVEDEGLLQPLEI